MKKNAQDEALIAARLAETIKSIDDMKLGHEALVRMAATYALGYFDLKRLVETQEKTIDQLMAATSIQAKGLKAANADAAKNAKITKLASTVLKEYLAQAEAIDAFSPLSSFDAEAREKLIGSNTAARRIDAGIKLQKSKIARAAVSSRPDIKLKAKQKRDFWDKHIGSVRDSGEPVNNALDIIDALSKRDPRCASISTSFIKEWAKGDGMELKPGRRKTKK